MTTEELDPFLAELAAADEGEKATPADLAAVTKYGNHLMALHGTLARLEEEAKAIKKQVNEIAFDKLPKMMKDIGIRSLELSTGQTLKLASDLKASLPKARSDEVMKYVRENGGDDIIKQIVTIDAGRGKANAVAAVIDEAEKLGLECSETESIAAPTYSKWIRERLKDNKPTDLSLLGAFEFERVDIK